MSEDVYVDYYAVLNVEFGATEKEIRKAYRKASLACHPDRVGDDPVLADRFLLITKAADILCDPAKKRIFDDRYQALAIKVKRDLEMDAKRREMKQDLEAKEAEASLKRRKLSEKEEEKLRIERLRDEGMQTLLARSVQLQQEKHGIIAKSNSIAIAKEKVRLASTTDCMLKAKWSKEHGDILNEDDVLKRISKVAPVDRIIMKSGKRQAHIIFKDLIETYKVYSNDALRAVFSFSWFEGTEPAALPYAKELLDSQSSTPRVMPSFDASKPSSSLGKGEKYEQMTLQRMRQLERQKLEEELLKEEENEDL